MTRRPSFIENVVYAPLWLALHALALLPFRLLYLISDALWLLVYGIVRYRVKVVRQNLSESFPDKSPEELRLIERKFYHHLCDYFVETIKLLHISDEQMRRRCVMENVDEVTSTLMSGRSIAVYAAHFGNWEWLTSIVLSMPEEARRHFIGQIYQPLNNRWMDRFFLKLRGRFRTTCVAKDDTLRTVASVQRSADGRRSLIGYIADQHPRHNAGNRIVQFLNHPTAFLSGTEAIARHFDMAVFVFDMVPTGRGYYRVTLRHLSADASAEQEGAITDAFALWLERRVNRYPEQWLWTHKRWKRPVTTAPEPPASLINPISYDE